MPTSTVVSVCVDASLVIRFLGIGTKPSPLVEQWDRWEADGVRFVAPTLFHYEIANTIRRFVVHGELSTGKAPAALQRILDLSIELYGDADFHRRALELADHLALPAAYDAHYLALAERLGAELWTADRRLFHNAERHFPWVHLFEG